MTLQRLADTDAGWFLACRLPQGDRVVTTTASQGLTIRTDRQGSYLPGCLPYGVDYRLFVGQFPTNDLLVLTAAKQPTTRGIKHD